MAGFPNSPSIGETYTLGTKVWEWDGTIWKIKTTGAVGPQGVQGVQGNQGTAGAAGVQGNQGWQGSVGPQGNQGRQGVSGPQGNQGNQGLKGDQGNQGNQGIAGLSATGVQGPQGNQGRQGISGPQGNQGRQGVSGPQGNQGRQGNQGNEGPTGFVSTPGNLSLASGKFRLHPLYGSTVDDDPNGNYWLQQTNPGIFINGIEYDQDSDITIFNRYAEREVYVGNAAASLTANLFLGNIFEVAFAGYTGTCTINITGGDTTSSFTQNLLFIFDNQSGNEPPTVVFTHRGTTGSVLFSQETGAPVFGATSQFVLVPMMYSRQSGANNYWYGGSQLTFNL